MAKKGERRPKPPVGDQSDPDGFAVRLGEYLDWLRVKNFAEVTVKNRDHYLRAFIVWCAERGLTRPHELTRPILERYARYLYYYRSKKGGRPLSFGSQHLRLVPVRTFFQWLVRHNYLLSNPASELELPKRERRLPKHVLTVGEADAVMSQPDVESDLGIRDRAILETLYSTGMRRVELIGLKVYDVDVERGTVMIRQGKGGKERMVPVGERALDWMNRYLVDVRPSLVVEPDERVLYLTQLGGSFAPDPLTRLVRGYVKAAELGKSGACHLFRHTMATVMLEGGADIRYIQAMLGHASLSTTQIYTQVSIRQLQHIHAMTHPSARRGHHRRDGGDAEGVEEAARHREPVERGGLVDELLSLLAAEPDDAEEVADGGDDDK